MPSAARRSPPAAAMMVEPGHRHDYGEPYYGGFVRDLDGNKIEATFWDAELAQKLGMG